MTRLLEGIRVLDFTQVLSGPTLTRYLSELGAEIIKVEPPRGDTTRATATVKNGRSGFFVSVNRGKRSLGVDLKSPEGRDLVLSLVPKCDIVVENFSPGAIERLGFGWDTLHALHPGLVMCSISGFGQRGPMARLPGYDGVAQAYTGITSLLGEKDGPPIVSGAAVGDVLTGVNGVAAVLGALFFRERTGEGQRVEVSVLDAYMQAHDAALQTYSLSGGESIQTRSGQFHPLACPYGVFKTVDGYVFIAAAADRHWLDLCAAMDRDDLAELGHRWADRPTREADRDLVNQVVEDWLMSQPSRDEAVTVLQQHRVPAGPVLAIDEVVHHGDMREMGAIVTADDPVTGPIDVPGFPLQYSAVEVGSDSEAPFLGEHNHEILIEVLGLDEQRYQALTDSGVLRAEPVTTRPSRQRPLIDDPPGSERS